MAAVDFNDKAVDSQVPAQTFKAEENLSTLYKKRLQGEMESLRIRPKNQPREGLDVRPRVCVQS
jgi:hypothetical protein